MRRFGFYWRRLVLFFSFLFLLNVAMTAIPSSVALAAGDDPVLKAEADVLFDKGRYAEAYDLYKRLYAQTGKPALLYNQARALEAMGEYPEALDQLEAFARSAPPDVRAKVPRLDELTNELRARTTVVHVQTNVATARLYVRGKDLGVLDHDRTVRARSGDASIRVEANGYQPYVKNDLSLPGGGLVEVDAQLKPSRSADDNSSGGAGPAAEPLTSKWWFWTAIAVVVVGGATASIIALTTEKSPDQGTFSPSPIHVKTLGLLF